MFKHKHTNKADVRSFILMLLMRFYQLPDCEKLKNVDISVNWCNKYNSFFSKAMFPFDTARVYLIFFVVQISAFKMGYKTLEKMITLPRKDTN
jgi:hypothetical protein